MLGDVQSVGRTLVLEFLLELRQALLRSWRPGVDPIEDSLTRFFWHVHIEGAVSKMAKPGGTASCKQNRPLHQLLPEASSLLNLLA